MCYIWLIISKIILKLFNSAFKNCSILELFNPATTPPFLFTKCKKVRTVATNPRVFSTFFNRISNNVLYQIFFYICRILQFTCKVNLNLELLVLRINSKPLTKSNRVFWRYSTKIQWLSMLLISICLIIKYLILENWD